MQTSHQEPRGADPGTRKPSEKPRPGWVRIVRQYFVDPFVGSNNPPWFDARGIAVGLAVGFGLPIGTQVLSMALLRAMFRYNTVVAFAFSWVNNPFTMIPMYYGYYYVGSLILGKPLDLTGETFHRLMGPIVHANHFVDAVSAFAALGWDILMRWAVTAIGFGVTSAVLGYLIGNRVQKAHCRKKAEQMGITYDKLLSDLEKSIGKRAKTPEKN